MVAREFVTQTQSLYREEEEEEEMGAFCSVCLAPKRDIHDLIQIYCTLLGCGEQGCLSVLA